MPAPAMNAGKGVVQRSARDARQVLAVLVGLAPGLAFPFLLALCFDAHRSDVALLAWSVMLTITTVVKFGIELNTISAVSAVVDAGGRCAAGVTAEYRRRMTRFALVATGVGYTILVPLYGIRTADLRGFLTCAAVLLPLPILTAWSSIESGWLVARSRITPTLLTQSLRTAVPLVVTIVCWNTGLLVPVMVAAVAGELLRWRILARINRSLEPTAAVGKEWTDPLSSKGMAWQGVAMMTSQSSPFVDRTFLAGAPQGSITSYELSDKVYAVEDQIILSLMLGRVAEQARVAARDGLDVARALALRHAAQLGVLAVGISAVLVTVSSTALVAGMVPEEWAQGLRWFAIVSIGTPASVCAAAMSRFLVVSGRQHLVARLTLVSVTLNAMGDLLLFPWLGPVGIIISTVIARVGSATAYVIVVKRLALDVRMADVPQPRESLESEPAALLTSATEGPA